MERKLLPTRSKTRFEPLLKIIDTATGKIIYELGEIRKRQTTRRRYIPVQGHGGKRNSQNKSDSLLTSSVVSAVCSLKYSRLYILK